MSVEPLPPVGVLVFGSTFWTIRPRVSYVIDRVLVPSEVPFDDPASCLRNVWNLYQYGKSPAAAARDKETFG